MIINPGGKIKKGEKFFRDLDIEAHFAGTARNLRHKMNQSGRGPPEWRFHFMQKDQTQPERREGFGYLPSCAPLANPYVPFQQNAPAHYALPQGLVRGTLFPGLDLPFMGMVNNTELADTPLGELMALDFVIKELQLYLDTHADDTEAFDTLQQYIKLFETGRAAYVRKYGPITICDTVLSKTYRFVDGTCGTVRDGILPGFYGYEAGQCCVGDQYAWYAAHCGLNQWELTDKAARLTPGESGLVAVDWWNGSRSPYMNEKLKGVISGLRLSTRPEEIYRAMLESTAFGCRNIYDRFRQAGFRFREIRATGGIPGKNPLVMQIYADVLGLPIRLAGMQYGSALGSAMFAGLAAGAFANMTEAMDRMEDLSDTVYTPNPENTEIYDRLYGRYRRIIDFFRQEYENESVKEENAPSAKRKTLLC